MNLDVVLQKEFLLSWCLPHLILQPYPLVQNVVVRRCQLFLDFKQVVNSKCNFVAVCPLSLVNTLLSSAILELFLTVHSKRQF